MTDVCIYIYIYIYVGVCVLQYIYIFQNFSFVNMYIYVCVCVCMCFAIHIYIYIYIYIFHPQTDCFVVSKLFSGARHVGRLKLGSKPAQLYVRLSIGSAWRIWGILKKSVELSSASGEDGWLSLARRSPASGLVAGATRVGEGADGKARIERMCITLLMSKNL